MQRHPSAPLLPKAAPGCAVNSLRRRFSAKPLVRTPRSPHTAGPGFLRLIVGFALWGLVSLEPLGRAVLRPPGAEDPEPLGPVSRGRQRALCLHRCSSCLALAGGSVRGVCKSLGMSIWFPSPVPPPASRPGSSVTGDILNSQEIGESLIVFSSLSSFFCFFSHAAEQKVHPQFSPCPWEAVYQDWVSVQDVYFIFLHYKSFWNLILLATKLCLELRAQGVNSCRPSLLVLILLTRPPIRTGYCLGFFLPPPQGPVLPMHRDALAEAEPNQVLRTREGLRAVFSLSHLLTMLCPS